MNETWTSFFGGVVATLAIVVVIMLLSSLSVPTHPLPMSGRVTEKMEAFTGYDNVVHILKVERAEGRYAFIVVTTQTWNFVVVGVQYEFASGEKSGYSTAVESVPE